MFKTRKKSINNFSTDEPLPPRDIFEQLQTLYEAAGAGSQVIDMGHTVILSGKPFLGGTQYGGFLFFRHTFQVPT